MKLKFTLVCLALCLGGCKFGSDTGNNSSDVTKDQPTAGLAYRIAIENKTVPDSDSPLGSWEIDRSYPVIQPGNNPKLAVVLNREIDKTVHQYTCDNGKGDEYFTSKVERVSATVFSMSYSATWMCASMPHPDSTDGVLNFDLKNPHRIVLKNEFKDDKYYAAFSANLLRQLNRKIEKVSHEDEMDCPQAEQPGPFVVGKDSVTIYSPTPPHGMDVCKVNVPVSRKELAKYLKPDSVLR